MAAVDIFNVRVLDNPAPFTNPLQFEITYDVREVLKEDIEWQVVYVGCAEDQSRDQELDAVLLPADNTGRFKFVLQVPAPDASRIPPADILGVTIVLLTCSYRGKEFIRVGYYVNNEHPDYPQVAGEQSEECELTVADDGVADNEGDDDVDDDMEVENSNGDASAPSASSSAAPPRPGAAQPSASAPAPTAALAQAPALTPASASVQAPLPTRVQTVVPTKMPDIERITRIISSEPTVTRFPLKHWDEPVRGTLIDPELSTDGMQSEQPASNDISV